MTDDALKAGAQPAPEQDSSETTVASPRRPSLASIVKWAFLVVAVGLLAWAVASRWDEVSVALADVGWGPFLLATLLALVALGFNTLSWRAVMRSVGLEAPVADAASVFLVSQAGKYVPGAVWPVLAQAEFAKEHGVSRVRAFTGSLVAMLVGVATAGVVGALALVASAPGDWLDYWWAVLASVALIIVLSPPVTRRLVGLALKVTRRSSEPVGIGSRALLESAGWSVLNWLALGVQAWIILRPLAPAADAALLIATGAFALSWLVGFLVVLAPAGIGAREGALAVLLASVATAPQAIAVAVLSRFAMTLADALGLVAGLVLRAVRRPRV